MAEKTYPNLYEMLLKEVVPKGCRCYSGYDEQAEYLGEQVVAFLKKNDITIPPELIKDPNPVKHHDFCEIYRSKGIDDSYLCDCVCHNDTKKEH